MATYVGMDEAGYGPTLGPLVLGTTVWHVPGKERINLYRHLRAGIRRVHEATPRHLIIDDSKKVYAGKDPLAALERSCLPLVGPHPSIPHRLETLLAPLAEQQWPAWYQSMAEPSQAELPVANDMAELLDTQARLQQALSRADTCLIACQATPIPRTTVQSIVRNHSQQGRFPPRLCRGPVAAGILAMPLDPHVWINVDRAWRPPLLPQFPRRSLPVPDHSYLR